VAIGCHGPRRYLWMTWCSRYGVTMPSGGKIDQLPYIRRTSNSISFTDPDGVRITLQFGHAI